MPTQIINIKNRLFTTTASEIWEHYTNSVRNSFYGSQSESNITLIFNPNSSISKNFQTVSYQGSNGWEVDYFISDKEGFDESAGAYVEFQDTTNSVKSYEEGKYTEGGVIFRVGFDRKENNYVSNLVNSSTVRPDEVLFGDSISGIKGYYATVKMSTDATTDIDGEKEIFSVASNFVVSAR